MTVGIAVVAAVISLSARTPAQGNVSFWVVAGTNRGESFSRNSLAGYNMAGARVAKLMALPDYYSDSVYLDGQRRIWIGQAWNDRGTKNRLQVWKDARQEAEFIVGERPEAGIVEFGRHIVVGCAERGFGFSLWAVSPDLRAREVAAVDRGEREFLLLTTIAANSQYIIAAALHDGQDSEPHASHTTIWWFDEDFVPKGYLYLGGGTAVWSIVPMNDGRFALLNNSAFLNDSPDVLFFDPVAGQITGSLQGAGFPFRGYEFGGCLYILNRVWSSVFVNSRRSITIIEANKARTIELPAGFGAVDIVAEENSVYLAVWERGDQSSDGVYRFNPATDELTQILRHPDASRVLLTGE